MWSSRNLGQVETTREKRRREVQFAKTGLVLEHSDRPLKRRAGNIDSCEIEPDFSYHFDKEDVHIQTMKTDIEEIVNVEPFHISSPEPPCRQVTEDIVVDNETSVLEASETLLPTSTGDKSMAKSTVCFIKCVIQKSWYAIILLIEALIC